MDENPGKMKWIGEWAAPGDARVTYERIGSLLISVLLNGAGMQTLWRSVGKMADVVHPAGNFTVYAGALVVALFVVAAKEFLFRHIMSVAQRIHSGILFASAWHVRTQFPC